MSERRVALITGAAHGQGRATALALAGAGYDIVALDVARPLAYPGYAMGTPDELASLGDECGALTAVADVRDDVAVTAAVDATIEHFGRIDLLFNNAGICAYGLAHELTEDEWDAMLDINLKGAWIVGRRLATDPHSVDEELRTRLSAQFSDAEIVLLTGFGAIMVATNVVNDALGVPLDGYLEPYRAQVA